MNMQTSTDIKTSRPEILVWDLPVRVFHWLLALSFAGAYLTSESERWKLVHVSLGYTMAGLVAFRLIWGVIGTTHARFSSFVRGPAAVMQYLKSALAKNQGDKIEHHTGHNPAGAIAIVALLALTLVAAVTGWVTYNELSGEWVAELHEGAANVMLGVVVLHLVGVVSGSWLHKENLVRGMITGRKQGAMHESIVRNWWPLAIAIVVTVLGFWWYQWQSAPAADATVDAGAPTAEQQHRHKHADHDHD
jgi:cytochrome b